MESSLFTIGLAALTGFIVTYLVMPSVLEVAYKKKLYDVPDERKVHLEPIPSLGGVGIFIGMLIAYTIWGNPTDFPQFKYILVSYLILFFVGIKDDLVLIAARYKFVIQIFVALILCYGGLLIDNFHGVLGIHEIPILVSYLFTVFFIVGITNAFNLIDGIDGLAGGLGGINCLTLGALLLAYGKPEYSILAFAISGSLLAFLRYNFGKYPNKLFMGDTGSLLIGFSISVLGIQFLQVETNADFVAPPFVLAGIMAIPIIDTTRVIFIRLSQGKSPFTPDKNHLHHEFLKSGFSHKAASLVLYGINLLFVFVVFWFRESTMSSLTVIMMLVGTLIVQAFVFYRYFSRDNSLKKLNVTLEDLESENQFLNR